MWSWSLEIGLWNAWILQMIYFFISMLPVMFRSIRYKSARTQTRRLQQISPTYVKSSWRSKLVYWTLFLLFFAYFIISFFIPLRFESAWFILGMALFVVGIILVFFVIKSWVETPPDTLITSGIYHYSRHPMYLSMFLTHIGVTCATMSLVLLVLTLVYILLSLLQAYAEEQFCLIKYGKQYQIYLSQTPRWIGQKK